MHAHNSGTGFHVAIVGAGIAGLALAMALRQKGICFTLYEEASQFSAVGAGIGFGPNGLRAMDLIEPGFLPEYEKICVGNKSPDAQHVFFEGLLLEEGLGQDQSWYGKSAWGHTNFARKSAHRKALLDIMTRFIPMESVNFNKRLTDIEQHPDKVVLRFADGEVAQASMLAGADGISSMVRKHVLESLYPSEVEPVYADAYCYQAVIFMQQAEEILGDLTDVAKFYFGYKRSAVTYRISGGQEFNFLLCVADDNPWTADQAVTTKVSHEAMMADFEGPGVDNRFRRLTWLYRRFLRASEIQDTTMTSRAYPIFSLGEVDAVKAIDPEALEVFQRNVDGVEFRTVSWQRATVVFLKINFAMSIPTTPNALATFGAVGGGLSLVAWIVLNPLLANMMGFLWGRVGRELVGVQIVIAQILISAGSIVSTSTALNALSELGGCTVVFALVSAIMIAMCSSIRTFSRLGWLTWFGFFTFFAAIFIFTVAVARQDRPAAALPTGDFDLGFKAIATPGFVVGMVSSATYLSEYRKAVLWAGVLVGIIYVVFSMVIYAYCGIWLSVPALDSADTLFKKISYKFLLPGLIIGIGIYQHIAAKYVFVRLLRGSKHLQANTVVYWSTWLSINVVLGIFGFVIAESVPILSFLLGLAGSLCFVPFSLVYPSLLWIA
ncbi:hypothetical protein E8E11_002995 [Didymella keratinophila]|nr:hypothetical protein E8E11_002995 [Didymella keratinophila]